MNRPTTFLAALLLALPLGAAATSVTPPADPHAVYFEADADAVGATAQEILKLFAAGYDRSSKRQIIVAGYGDPGEVAAYGEDGPGYCIGLAQRRASNVRDLLVGQFDLPAGMITTQAFGCDRPASAGATGAVNRRVEVSLGEVSGW